MRRCGGGKGGEVVYAQQVSSISSGPPFHVKFYSREIESGD